MREGKSMRGGKPKITWCVLSPLDRLNAKKKYIRSKIKRLRGVPEGTRESFWKRLANKAEIAAAKRGLNMHCVQDH